MSDEILAFEARSDFKNAMKQLYFAQAFNDLYGTNELARTIRLARKANGLSQVALASMIGSSQSCLSRIEGGKVPDIGLSLVRKIGWALGCNIHVIFKKHSAS